MSGPKLTLTIAGNDASGGAGIAADLKTFAEYGTYGIAALTVIATMDPENSWRHSVTPINAQIVKDQLTTAFAGPAIAAAKTGMLPNPEVTRAIADMLKEHPETPLVVIKGGKSLEGVEAVDLIFDGESFAALTARKIPSPNSHGAGCTFAADITAGLAKGLDPVEAVRKAKHFVTEAMQAGFAFNEYVGPVFHSGYRLNRQSDI